VFFRYVLSFFFFLLFQSLFIRLYPLRIGLASGLGTDFTIIEYEGMNYKISSVRKILRSILMLDIYH
jgi:hypothetical protein